MSLGLRITGALACVIVALDCFVNDGALGIPQWAWTVVGICWLFNAFGIITSRGDA